jgi:hypothetical protein
MHGKRCAIGALVLAIAACHNGTDVIVAVPPGTWGGQGAVMVASDSGAAFTFNCASGSVDGPLPVDANGQFSWSGTFARISPVPGSPHDTPHPATYHGTANASQIVMALTVPELAIESDPVTLTYGNTGNLALCP